MYDPVKGKARRESLGISVKALAERLGVSAQAVYQWERGERKPSLPMFVAIAHHLCIPTASLMEQAKDSATRQAIQLANIYQGGSHDGNS
ncbi:helix-turn-helix domain-containing protein [Kitasatospora sp. NPDC088548]|uniref:helix-turn-helix domain-containing protein n=1 Tax=Kitasatospora sp. NPDC088548 TaxID=3364075 RepID=UPI003825A425